MYSRNAILEYFIRHCHSSHINCLELLMFSIRKSGVCYFGREVFTIIHMVLQSVVVIHDASRETNSKVFHWALNGLSLNSGDNLTLVVVLHQVITPCTYVYNLPF